MGPGNERGPRERSNELRAQRAEQFPHLGNYTLTLGSVTVISATCLKSALPLLPADLQPVQGFREDEF